MPEKIMLLRNKNVPVEKLPTPNEIRQAVLGALRNCPLHFTALRRILRTQWTKLPQQDLDEVLEELLQQHRIELVRNGQSITYRLKRRNA